MTPEQVQAKLTHLADAIAKLRTMPQSSLEDFRADDRNLDSALHRLQVAIQILIDVGSHVVAQLGLGAPETSHDILERLEKAGRLPSGATARFGKMFAFRNRVVHLYDRIDDDFVYDVVTQHLGDLEDLATHYIDALRD
jgi:uncharacterized protein YutE (UPF0331/DUF86 family)